MYLLINRFAREVFHGHLTLNHCITIIHYVGLKNSNKSLNFKWGGPIKYVNVN